MPKESNALKMLGKTFLEIPEWVFTTLSGKIYEFEYGKPLKKEYEMNKNKFLNEHKVFLDKAFDETDDLGMPDWDKIEKYIQKVKEKNVKIIEANKTLKERFPDSSVSVSSMKKGNYAVAIAEIYLDKTDLRTDKPSVVETCVEWAEGEAYQDLEQASFQAEEKAFTAAVERVRY